MFIFMSTRTYLSIFLSSIDKYQVQTQKASNASHFCKLTNLTEDIGNVVIKILFYFSLRNIFILFFKIIYYLFLSTKALSYLCMIFKSSTVFVRYILLYWRFPVSLSMGPNNRTMLLWRSATFNKKTFHGKLTFFCKMSLENICLVLSCLLKRRK